MIPFDVPPVPLIYEPVALTLWMLKPIPPADWDIFAHLDNVSKIPSMLSSVVDKRKQLDNCGFGVPALNKVGVACINHFSDIKNKGGCYLPSGAFFPKTGINSRFGGNNCA